MPLKVIPKKSLSGIELEFLLLDENGRVIEDTNLLRRQLKKEHGLRLIQEGGKPQLEISSLPKVNVGGTTEHMLETLQRIVEVLGRRGLRIFPYATYPGTYRWEVNDKTYYKKSSLVFGPARYRYGNLTQGLHYHYTLPRGTFERRSRTLKTIGESRYKDSLVHHYNLSVAMDPAVTTLMQCSPFLQGRFVGKDARLFALRDGEPFGDEQAMYHEMPLLGKLPSYEHTASDIMHRAEKCRDIFTEHAVRKDVGPEGLLDKMTLFQFTWNPVRINKLGTLEIRSMDANGPEYVVAAVTALKFIFRKVHQEFLTVTVDEAGIEEPFKLEGNTVHVPPYAYVFNVLQVAAARRGMADKEVRRYVRRFMHFAKKCLYEEYDPAVQPFRDVVRKKRTISDLILGMARRRGASLEKPLPERAAREIALALTDRLSERLAAVQELIGKLDG